MEIEMSETYTLFLWTGSFGSYDWQNIGEFPSIEEAEAHKKSYYSKSIRNGKRFKIEVKWK
jgi:hypothetical protein